MKKLIISLLILSLAALATAQDEKSPTPEADPLAPPAPEVAPSAAPAGAGKGVSKSRRVETRAGTITLDAGANGQGGRVTLNKGNRNADETYLPRSAKTGRTLVIQTSKPDADAAADAEEDLSVMALILRKATGARGEDRRLAMGIEVFGSSSGARNIYLQDYGALFLLGVPFPLVAPSEKTEDAPAKETTSSDWQDAREEYLNEGLASIEDKLVRAWQSASRGEDYDAEKVEALKNSLLDALKNASHIRILKPSDMVTVVIQGTESLRAEKPGSGRTAKNSRRAETVMTLRAKKADIDSFAKGSIKPEEFSQRVSTQTYFRRGDTSVATSLFLAPFQ